MWFIKAIVKVWSEILIWFPRPSLWSSPRSITIGLQRKWVEICLLSWTFWTKFKTWRSVERWLSLISIACPSSMSSRHITVPKVHSHLCSSRCLVMSFEEGVQIDKVDPAQVLTLCLSQCGLGDAFLLLRGDGWVHFPLSGYGLQASLSPCGSTWRQRPCSYNKQQHRTCMVCTGQWSPLRCCLIMDCTTISHRTSLFFILNSSPPLPWVSLFLSLQSL